MASSLDPVWMVPVDDITARVKQRERLLIEQENEMFRAARDSATSAEERARWDDFIALRQANLSRACERKEP